MPKKKVKSAGATPPSKGRLWHDPDDAPAITEAMLDRATIVKDGKVIQRSLRRGDKIE
jgi:hypothetical protein